MAKTLALNAPPLLRLQLPAFERVALTLVGCGGTGSHIASGLVAIAQALDERGVRVDMMFIDPDRVEPKNVGRQLFSSGDVGQPKAAILAGRLNAAFGLGIGAAVRKIDERDTFRSSEPNTLSIVVGAVDNRTARALIARAVNPPPRYPFSEGDLWWLDTGNSEHAGQVSLGNTLSLDNMRGAVGLGMTSRLPAPSLINPDLVLAPEPKTLKPTNGHTKNGAKDPSCAELAAEGAQGLMVNRMAAAWALALLHDFLLGELKYFALDFDLVYGGVRARALDLPTLAEASGLKEKELTAQPQKGKTR